MQDMPGMTMDQPKAAAPNPSQPDHDMSNMPGMDRMPMSGVLGRYPMSRDASGTSWQPDDAEHHGLHFSLGDWQLMAHATLWGIYDTQSGPRGADKFFVPGMFMASARRDLDAEDTLSFRAMLSPDPLMGKSGYPLLLATGETANGVTPLIDRQHPHDLFMELSGTYSRKLSDGNSAFFYFGYPGEPALGPTAFMHRASSMDIPEAPITHHWMDSTHIAFGVATAGFVHDDWKLEVSQFTGREPDQNRYDFDTPRFDSTSVRVTWNPDEHWSLQTSWGHLVSPEQLSPLTNESRTTASATYVTHFGDESSFAATLGWGLKSESTGANLNGALLEAEYKPADRWTAFARAEWEQNDELVPGGAIHSVSELTLGGIRDWNIAKHVKFGLGASYTFDFVPQLTPTYSTNPHGIFGFMRLKLE
jgi:hypothetical protein